MSEPPRHKPLIFLDPHPRTEAMIYDQLTAESLAKLGRVVAHWGSRAPDDLVEEILPEVEIIVGQTALPEARLDSAPNLRAILNVKGNWEPNIDYAAAQARGIWVLSAAPAMAPAVAEYCLGQAIALARRLPEAHRRFRKGTERYGISGNAGAFTLHDTYIGLIGYGNLGRALVPLLRPFSRNIAVYDPWLSDAYLKDQGVHPMPLLSVLGSKVIFVLAGATRHNAGFLNAHWLGKINTGAILILASRAEVIDLDALLALTTKGKIRAAIDVFPEEPVPQDHPIRTAPNVQCTAHIAGGMLHSYGRIRTMMLDDIAQILRGLPPMQMQRAEPHLAAISNSR